MFRLGFGRCWIRPPAHAANTKKRRHKAGPARPGRRARRSRRLTQIRPPARARNPQIAQIDPDPPAQGNAEAQRCGDAKGSSPTIYELSLKCPAGLPAICDCRHTSKSSPTSGAAICVICVICGQVSDGPGSRDSASPRLYLLFFASLRLSAFAPLRFLRGWAVPPPCLPCTQPRYTAARDSARRRLQAISGVGDRCSTGH